ncbi:MAG: pantoate--beta-alanine ligase [Mangrovicoccus sp.]|nr:pantoate--beta-alanine ligase [Mangrovicoccus sp.]
MEIYTSKAEMRAALPGLKSAGSLALVPTMGYLHAGHMALVRAARAACDKLIVSIFVNPTQFGEAEDLENYPRDAERDLEMLRAEGVDGVFLPQTSEMYHPQAQTIVETTDLAHRLLGKVRPGHFRGVATVVTKLFNIVQPDQAFFGEKDYQQLQVIRTVTRDLDMPVAITGVPTQREPDGLAMSSRNVRLSPEQRASAPVLSQAMAWAQEALHADPQITAEALRDGITARISAEPLAQVESVDLQDASSLGDLSGPLDRPAVILLAVRFDPILLIDQRVISPK